MVEKRKVKRSRELMAKLTSEWW